VGLGLAITVAVSAWTAKPPAPKAVVPFTSFAFGDVYRGEDISQIFVIRNEGDADLVRYELRAQRLRQPANLAYLRLMCRYQVISQAVLIFCDA
jgi:hypothetical protein